ncbi:MAG TPA: right-handed parallel beta-helix repeat-containing protein, partial [Phycisphaerae bacterium]|nr:right-handed parallel beta-helix repeat-containing protein [Phycisphaerae bacterium]
MPAYPILRVAVFVAVAAFVFPLSIVNAADCNNNGIDDTADIAAGTSADCNGDGVPDECGVIAVDVVFIIDVSRSVATEETKVCAEATGLAGELAALGVPVSTIAFLQIADVEPPFNCIDNSVLERFGESVPGDRACGPLGVAGDQSDEESWGPATAVVAARFPWRTGSMRIIVPVSDEAACQGMGLQSECDTADYAAVDNAGAVAVDHRARVFPVASSGTFSCARDLMVRLAAATRGDVVDLYPQAAADLAASIAAQVAIAAADCNANGVMDACDIATGQATDCDADTVPDACQLAGNDCDSDGVLDACELDCDTNGTPDDCEGGPTIGPVLYVDGSVAGGDGTDWAHAYADLQDALAQADGCQVSEVWVAAGTYFPGTDPADTFRLRSGVALYGGFAGWEDAVAQRDIAANETILSGDISASGQDALHVVTADGQASATAVLDGFTITGGRTTETGAGGGGLFIRYCSPTIRNCRFTDNQAYLPGGEGGAVYLQQAWPWFTACEFIGNSAFEGGAIFARQSDLILDRSQFLENSAKGSGGGICLVTSASTISNSFFGSNGAVSIDGGGGAVGVFEGSDALIYNSVFTDNSAGFGGGIDLYSLSTGTIVNCSFSDNFANRPYGGGALENSQSLDTVVSNSVFWNNLADGTLQQITQVAGNASLRITHSDVQGGQDGIVGPFCDELQCHLDYRASNIDSNPRFIDPRGPDGLSGTIDDNLRLPSYSPCVNAGSNGAVVSIMTDADGYDRIEYGTVDIGAYEVFVDCNSNQLPDFLDPMDYDTDGSIDLRDFQYLQLCFNSSEETCLRVFDRAPTCGIVDLDDFLVFGEQFSGPSGPVAMANGLGSAMISGESNALQLLASFEQTQQVVEASTVAFELQMLGGGDPVSLLAAHTEYEVHYLAD